jgi:hypothetical protein
MMHARTTVRRISLSAPIASAAQFGNLSLQLTFDNVSPMYVGVTAQVPLALLHGVGELDPAAAAAADSEGYVVKSLASTVRFDFGSGRVLLDLFFPMPFVRENGIFGPFIYEMHHFAKTGSGQT